MIFVDLIKKINPVLLNEKYYKYTFPDKKITQMYDFYVLDYLNTILGYAPANFRDLPMDLVDSVKDGVNTLFPLLREELLGAVFYAFCAEMRHAKSFGGNDKHFKKGSMEAKLYSYFLRYITYHLSSEYKQNELSDIYGIKKISSKTRAPVTEKDNDKSRNITFKAAHYAIGKAKATKLDFAKMSETMFRSGNWNMDSNGDCSFGGPKWADICKGWILLYNSDEIDPAISHKAPPKDIVGDLEKGIKTAENPNQKEKDEKQRKKREVGLKEPMSVAIDHVYDLQHNNDTVFQKLKSYYNNRGYEWILATLDFKANIQSYFDLLSHSSSTVRAMAPPILYNKLGSTWEQYAKTNSPSENFNMDEYEQEDIELSGLEDKDIKYSFVTPARNNVTNFTQGEPYKVYGFPKEGYLLLKNDNGEPQNVVKYRVRLLKKKENDQSSKPSGDYVHSQKENIVSPEEDLPEGAAWFELLNDEDAENVKVGDHVKCVNISGVSNSLTHNKIYEVVKVPGGVGDVGLTTIHIKNDFGNIAGYDYSRFWLLYYGDNPVKTPEVYVKCINTGNNALIELGHIYMVQTPTTSFYNIINNHDVDFEYPRNLFDSPQTLNGVSITKDNIQFGDTVECINYSSDKDKLHLGHTYTVVGFPSTNSPFDTLYITIENDDGIYVNYISSKFILVKNKSDQRSRVKSPEEEYQNFKSGDMVECISTGNNENITIGKKYNVIGNYYDGYISTINDSGHVSHYASRHFKLVEKDDQSDTSKNNSQKFKKGDLVKCVDPGMYLTKDKVYMVGEIIDDFENNSYYVKVINDVGNSVSYYSNRFAFKDLPISPPRKKDPENNQKIRFKKGDVVTCIETGDNNYITLGRDYVIIGYGSTDHWVMVKADNDIEYSYKSSYFKLKTPKRNTEFKKGDIVECVDSSGWGRQCLTEGKHYEVLYFNDNDSTVKFMSDVGHTVSGYAYRFKLVSPKTPRISQLDTLRTSDTTPPFKTGNMVKCVNNKDWETFLTIGGIYQVKKLIDPDYSKLIEITDDTGDGIVVSYTRFELV